MAASLPSQTLQGLTWLNPSGDQKALVAPVDLDFTTYGTITVSPQGNFGQFGQTVATGVVVDNLLNAAPIVVNMGPIRETIPPFTKQTLQLVGNVPSISFQGASSIIRATFFWGTFSGSTSGSNFYQAQLQAGLAVETGMIYMFGGQVASIPAGYLLCDGTAVSRTTYAGLFSIIGNIYGPGDGSTTFNLPDFRGRGPRGSGTGTSPNPVTPTYAVGATGGIEQWGLLYSQLPLHTHGVLDPGHGHGYNTSRADTGAPIGTPPGFQIQDVNVGRFGNNLSLGTIPFIFGHPLRYDPQVTPNYYYMIIANAPTGITLGYAGGTGGVKPDRTDAQTQPVDLRNPYLIVTFIIKT